MQAHCTKKRKVDPALLHLDFDMLASLNELNESQTEDQRYPPIKLKTIAELFSKIPDLVELLKTNQHARWHNGYHLGLTLFRRGENRPERSMVINANGNKIYFASEIFDSFLGVGTQILFVMYAPTTKQGISAFLGWNGGNINYFELAQVIRKLVECDQSRIMVHVDDIYCQYVLDMCQLEDTELELCYVHHSMVRTILYNIKRKREPAMNFYVPPRCLDDARDSWELTEAQQKKAAGKPLTGMETDLMEANEKSKQEMRNILAEYTELDITDLIDPFE